MAGLGELLDRALDLPSLTPSHPECHPNPAASVFLQLCLRISNLVQGFNVHLGTLIGKTGSPGGGPGASEILWGSHDPSKTPALHQGPPLGGQS